MRRLMLIALVLLAAGGSVPSFAWADDPGAPTQHESDQGQQEPEKGDFGDKCRPGIPGIDQIAEGACDVAKGAADRVVGAAGDAAGAAAGSVLDQVTEWMTDAATWTTKQIARAVQATTTPELGAAWYRERFASMATLGIGLSALVAMLALASAAIRRDPEALGATVYGMFRAGLGTGLVIVLTVLALGVADGIVNTVAGHAVGRNAGEFWSSVAGAWGSGNFAGFGSSAIAFFFALVQVVAAVAVWIELLLRQAAIYVAVLFMPAALAASIWPPLREWESRLTRALFVLIAMKPVVVTVLSLAGSAAEAGLTGEAQHDVGVLLAAIVIFALAAFSPWGLMALVSMSAEGGWAARSVSAGAREGVASGAARVGGTLGAARGMGGSRIHRGRGGGGPGGASGAGGGSGPAGGAGGGPGSPPAAGGGAAAASSGGGVADSGGGAAAKAAGPVGAVAAAAGMGYQAVKSTGARAGETAEAAGDDTSQTSGPARRGASTTRPRGEPGGDTRPAGGASGSGGPRPGGSRPGGRARGGGSGGEAAGGGPARPAAPSPRTGRRPGGPGGPGGTRS